MVYMCKRLYMRPYAPNQRLLFVLRALANRQVRSITPGLA